MTIDTTYPIIGSNVQLNVLFQQHLRSFISNRIRHYNTLDDSKHKSVNSKVMIQT